MVDVEHRINSHAHSAGLKRLSARAHAGTAPPSTGGRRVYFSFAAYARTAIDHLRSCRVQIEKGLSDEEFARVEAAYGFTFPPDLRAILHEGLPVGDGFPNWRCGNSRQLQMRFDLPIAGLLYEVIRGNVWWKQWGTRPVDKEQAIRVALTALRKAPVLVPVYSHCYIPSSPNLAGNPVYFVYMKDVFIAGNDVADFFQRDQFTPHDYFPPTSLPDFMEWVEDNGNRVVRMGSGRDIFKERGRVYGKENLLVSSRVGDDDSAQEGQNESVPIWRLPDALSESTEPAEKNWDMSLERGDFESWGRNLDALVAKHSDVLFKSLDNFGRQRPTSKGFEQKSQRHRSAGVPPGKNTSQDTGAPRFSYFEDTPLSSKTLMHFSMSAPPWASKAARRIEFWSELIEKRQASNGFVSDPLFSVHKVDCDVLSFSKNRGWDVDTATKETLTKFRSQFLPNWLASYLDDISLRLRKGGWEQDDIDDMMEPSPTSKPSDSFCVDRQGVLESLSKQAEVLSCSLREAGWSIRDVAEVLNVDLASFRDHRRASSKLTPEFAARLSTLAEYVVNA